jgi:hypothetical protein
LRGACWQQTKGKEVNKMAMMSELEQVLGKAILDKGFRARLLADPETAAASLSIKLTDAQVARIRGLDADLVEWWAQGFDALKGISQGFLW